MCTSHKIVSLPAGSKWAGSTDLSGLGLAIQLINTPSQLGRKFNGPGQAGPLNLELCAPLFGAGRNNMIGLKH